MSITFNIKAGKSLKLLTAGKYCDRDIVVNAVGGVGGGSSSHVARKDINFYDYDGTLLHSYTVAEAQALSELPELPTQDGLICQGWNFDLETIKAYNRAVDVGAMYITDDGKTRLYIHLEEGRTSPKVGLCVNGTVTVDWGDGTEPTVIKGTSLKTVVSTLNHEYANAGDYVISLSVNGEMRLSGSTDTMHLLCQETGMNRLNYYYASTIKRVEIGSNVTGLEMGAFYKCQEMSTVTIPNSVTTIGTYAFYQCVNLSYVTIPSNVVQLGSRSFSNCVGLSCIAIPKSTTVFDTYAFDSCYRLSRILIPDGTEKMYSYTFQYCYGLREVVIPPTVTYISSSSFFSCYTVKCYDFSKHTSIPTLQSNGAFSNMSPDSIFLVPAALFDGWKSATNWTYVLQNSGRDIFVAV